MTLTAEQLREMLFYNPETGEWIWLVSPCNSITIGDRAGHIDDHGYWRIGIKNRRQRAHRLAWLYMTGAWPAGEIDHKDMNRANCVWSNLRPASCAQNRSNTGARRHNPLGLKGVTKRPTGKYLASIQVNKKKIHIGLYITPEEAHAAYCLKAAELHGEFARVK
jgi:hypothetical protein